MQPRLVAKVTPPANVDVEVSRNIAAESTDRKIRHIAIQRYMPFALAGFNENTLIPLTKA